MVVYGHRQIFLCLFLTDDIVVQRRNDLRRLGDIVQVCCRILHKVLVDDLPTELHALIADEHAGAGDDPPHLFLIFSAERALDRLVWFIASIITHSFTSFFSAGQE